MPIKYQMLGGGGGTDLLLKVAPNISVTLSKEGYTQTLTTDESGQALFKNLKAGTYIVKFRSESTELQNEVVVLDKQEETFGVKQVKNLPLGAKLKFSSGKTFKLLKKNAKGHPSNSATFWSEYIIQIHRFDGVQYFDSYVHSTIMPSYYNELNEQEKLAVIEQERIAVTYTESGTDTSKKGRTNFYLLTVRELGHSDKYPTEYENLGFGSNVTRIKKTTAELARDYCTSDVYQSRSGSSYYGRFIQEDGSFSSGNDISGRGIVPACDLKNDAYVILDADGYYKVLKA